MGILAALLVGIDAYPPPLPALRGSVNDVTVLADLLRQRVPADRLALRVLTDAAATRDALLDGIATHLGRAGPGDAALLFFSGHGSQADAPPGLWAVEPDRRVETLVLVDSRTPDGWDVVDKELAVLLAEVAARGAHVVTVLDCCHSGSGTRASEEVGRVRLAPPDARRRPPSSWVPGAIPDAVGDLRALHAGWTLGSGSQVLLSACRAGETAKEVRVRGSDRGALSAAVEAALRAGGAVPTYRQLHRLATAGVLRRVPEQHPQLEASVVTDLDRPFLGEAVPPAPARIVLSRLPDGWSIDAGAVHGIAWPGNGDTTELAVHPLGAAVGDAPLATASVTRVLPERSLVSLSTDLDPDAVYRAVVTAVPTPPLRFAVTGDASELATAVRAAARRADATLLASVAGEADAEVVLRCEGTTVEVTGPVVRVPLVLMPGGQDPGGAVLRTLEQVARWLRVADLRNPTSGLGAGVVTVRLGAGGRVDDDGHLDLAYDGQAPPAFTVELTNATDSDLWCALLDLTDAFGVYADAFPAGSVLIASGETARVDLVGQVPDAWAARGVTSVTDRLKLVVSTLEFDPRPLQQEELDLVHPEPGTPMRGDAQAPRTTLERLLGRLDRRSPTRGAGGEAVADWRTDDYVVVTRRHGG